MVFSAGNVLTAAQLNDVTQSAVATYTPAVTGQGTATFSTLTGWYFRFGTSKLVFFAAYAVASGAGSGSSNVTITSPSNPYRGTRQVVPAHGEGIGVAGNALRSGWVLAFTGGSGAVWDRILLTDSNSVGEDYLIGSAVTTSTILIVQGWYREA